MNVAMCVRLLQVATRVLEEHPEAPAPCGVQVRDLFHGPSVEMQMPPVLVDVHVTVVGQIAAWAVALGVPVTLVQRSDYVELSAVGQVEDCRVRAWDHLSPDDALAIVSAAGVDLGERVCVAPEVLVAAAHRHAAAGAVSA